MSAPYFVPALDLLPYWPHDLLAPSDVPMLGRLGQYAGVTEFELLDYEGEVALVGTLALWDELTLDLPLVDGLQLVVGPARARLRQAAIRARLRAGLG